MKQDTGDFTLWLYIKGQNSFFFINLLNGGWIALEEIQVEVSQAIHNNAATI